MCYVDVAPMITAFREHPEQFDIRPARKGSTKDVIFDRKSRHKLYRTREWQLVPACDCHADVISRHQQAALDSAIGEWRATYWTSLLRAREIAAIENTARIEARAARNKKLLDKVIALVTFRWLRRPASARTPSQAALVGGDD